MLGARALRLRSCTPLMPACSLWGRWLTQCCSQPGSPDPQSSLTVGLSWLLVELQVGCRSHDGHTCGTLSLPHNVWHPSGCRIMWASS